LQPRSCKSAKPSLHPASRRWLAAAALALWSCATPSKPFEGHPVLTAIKFEGNGSIGSGELLQKIATAPTTGIFSKDVHYYDADLFAVDLKRIVRWYNEKGFYEAKILDVQEKKDDAGRVSVLVKIEEGRRAVVRQMDFQGVDALGKDEINSINETLSIHKGDDFDEDGYEKSKAEFQDGLKEHGFAEAKVSGEVKVKPEEGAAAILLTAEPGKRYKFGKVLVGGNRQIPGDQIARATGIDQGDRYSPTAMELAQQRVYNLGTFSGVRVGLEPLGDTPVATVRVNVREAPFETVRFGIGGTAEQTRYVLPKLHGEYTNRSLFGGLRRLELASDVGYAFVPDIFNYDKAQSGIVTETSAQLTIPNFYYPGLDAVARGEFDREFQKGFSYDEVAARFSLLYRRGRHSISPSINFVRYLNIVVNTGVDNTFTQSTKGSLAEDCPSGACTLTYPELRYTYDARDNVIETLEGFYATVDLQQTLRPGSFTYFRVEPEVRFYRGLFRYITLATRAEYGGLFTQRFFGGGQSFQRGYAPLQQGPKRAANPDADKFGQNTVPTGGTSSILLSAELRIHIDYVLNHLAVVPFVDASRIDNNPAQPWKGGLEVAPGLGLRYITPFGPLRLDVGYLLNPKEVIAGGVTDKLGNILIRDTRVAGNCNQMEGCLRQSRLAYHLTLGEAF
jgi:translocation and assembly module TamA